MIPAFLSLCNLSLGLVAAGNIIWNWSHSPFFLAVCSLQVWCYQAEEEVLILLQVSCDWAGQGPLWARQSLGRGEPFPLFLGIVLLNSNSFPNQCMESLSLIMECADYFFMLWLLFPVKYKKTLGFRSFRWCMLFHLFPLPTPLIKNHWCI